MSSLFGLMVRKHSAYFGKIWTIFTLTSNYVMWVIRSIHFLDLILDCQMVTFPQICMLNLRTDTNFSTIHHLIQIIRSIVFSQVLRFSRICSGKSDISNILRKWSHGFQSGGILRILLNLRSKKGKFSSKNRNNKRSNSFKVVPFVMTYHPKLKSMKKFILKYLDLLYMGNEVKRVFTWFYKCGGKRSEVCIIVNKRSTFAIAVIGKTYIINHRFDCNERCLVYLLTCNKCKM